MVAPRFCKTAVLCLVMLVALLLASSAFAERITVTPQGDGTITETFDHYYGGISYRCSSDDAVLYCFTGGYETQHVRIEIPITSLAGRNLNATNIMFNFYTLSDAYMDLTGVDYPQDGIITCGDYGYWPTDLFYKVVGGTAGWITVDATDYVKSQLSHGYTHAAFHFTAGADRGEIVPGDSFNQSAYLEIVPVPEPSSMLALFAGVSGLGGMLIRRRK